MSKADGDTRGDASGRLYPEKRTAPRMHGVKAAHDRRLSRIDDALLYPVFVANTLPSKKGLEVTKNTGQCAS